MRTKIDDLARSCDPMPILKAASAIRINKQSPDIAGGVNVGHDGRNVGAGDQGTTFGFSSDETVDVTPLTHSMSTRLELTDVRNKGDLCWLRPDDKTQMTIQCVPKIMEEIIEVVRLIPQESV